MLIYFRISLFYRCMIKNINLWCHNLRYQKRKQRKMENFLKYAPVFVGAFINKNRCNPLCIVGYNDFYFCHAGGLFTYFSSYYHLLILCIFIKLSFFINIILNTVFFDNGFSFIKRTGWIILKWNHNFVSCIYKTPFTIPFYT